MCTNTHTLTYSFLVFSLLTRIPSDIYILNSIVLYKLYYVYIFRYLYIAFKVCQGHEKTVPLSLDKKHVLRIIQGKVL